MAPPHARAWLGCLLAGAFTTAAAGCGKPEQLCSGSECDVDDELPAVGARDGGPNVVRAEQACAMQSTRATPGIDKQVDIVFVIDNSGSMAEEIAAVRENINVNFAQLIVESGVDFRVVVVSQYGNEGNSVCVDPPLAGAPCGSGLEASTSDVFFQYNLAIDSFDPLCKLLWAFDHPDAEGRAPYGYRQWLRADAQKVFVLITDDSASCLYDTGDGAMVELGLDGDEPFDVALRFHETLLARSPEQFGSAPDTRYAFYSIIGMAPNDPPTEPWFPHQELNPMACDTAPSPGLAYQALSVITDALRYPVCEGRGFDAVFRVLARSVVEAAKADCSFELPNAPPGQTIARSTINVEYRPGDGGDAHRFTQVPDAAQCSKSAFVLGESRIDLCPDACEAIQADREAEVRVLYGCNVDLM
jgi:hypothetical protein